MAKSSQNSIKHGIFVTKFLNRATPETIAEILARTLPLQGIRNRPSNLLKSTKGNPRSRAITPLPATAALSTIRKMASERLRP